MGIDLSGISDEMLDRWAKESVEELFSKKNAVADMYLEDAGLHDESKEDIIKVILETLGRFTKIKIGFDEELGVYFFRLMIEPPFEEKDLNSIDKLDEIFKHSRYKYRRFIVTI